MHFFLFIDYTIQHKSGGKGKFVYIEIPNEVKE